MEYRKEHDLLGERDIPADAYYGVHTLRAKENFAISNHTVPWSLITSIAMVKKACCQANVELGFLDKTIGEAIEFACNQVIEGKYSAQFMLDALQGGAGTSTNMNLNEVLANIALEKLGKQKGDYETIHPLRDVNMHQSTNDVYPTALKIAAINGFRTLSNTAAHLQGALQKKEQEFASIVTLGRTEMQEAVPMTLGSQFASFAEAIGRDRWRTFKAEERLRVVPIGGTAIGTGLTAPRAYIFLVIEKLRNCSGLGLTRAENALDCTANNDAFVEVAGMLAAHAVSIKKISNDLRYLHAQGDITLPACQAGSSIMPGKVNPVICEAAIQATIKVCANISIVTETASLGSLQINEFLPLLGTAILESLDLLIATDTMIARHVEKIQGNAEVCLDRVNRSTTIVTAFVPQIGYEAAQQLVNDYRNTNGITFRRFLEEKLGKKIVDETLLPQRLMALGFTSTGAKG